MSEGVAEPVLDDENLSFQDDPNKCKYQAENQRYSFIYCLHQLMPQYRWKFGFDECIFFCSSGAEEEESITSDEDVPFRDDINDQSYDPKAQRYACI